MPTAQDRDATAAESGPIVVTLPVTVTAHVHLAEVRAASIRGQAG